MQQQKQRMLKEKEKKLPNVILSRLTDDSQVYKQILENEDT